MVFQGPKKIKDLILCRHYSGKQAEPLQLQIPSYPKMILPSGGYWNDCMLRRENTK